ncbi:hypothetical protein [Streptomyces sp. ISL-11]|uniref:hypothetical protein n=1 Tax=Streptomyces sp. ISL-11 TaxID=2819174 RepID=UPI001BEAAC18|nr:hypothetical protein [Streptomyces sp. ISL-11]MBT2383090.1 hypothetical protein [Streptomyces sp. ISL-11]
MGTGIRMSAPPAGEPRFVAMFYRPASGWKVAAESSARSPVDHAVAAMIQTLHSRGEKARVEVWGPSEDGSTWRHLQSISEPPGKAASQASPVAEESPRSAREERLRDRRHQVLMAALAAVGHTKLEAADHSAVARLVDDVDEDTIRRVAQWLTASNR